MTENNRLLDNNGHSGRSTLHARRIEINDMNHVDGVQLMVHDGHGNSCFCSLTAPECVALACDLLNAADILRDELTSQVN